MALLEEMSTLTTTNTEFIWKKNKIVIDNGYLTTSGVINNIRVPLNAIETVVWSINPAKPTLSPCLKIIGKGIVLAEIQIGIDIINDVQDWILTKSNG
ncbi:hypothetical protein [Heyndrickxia oleronia]|jgi:hypothetical protein|uniref:Uncharacterized protein n=1 Tax=Heyndrickxia oleronia TaxID=38875 RepID=A0AAW6SSL6_9BACI|nr:hypothetical protein [Heyndrickxia oleronia]MDH5161830.1 hypothetical protein [Heyndrickxia oleronia]